MNEKKKKKNSAKSKYTDYGLKDVSLLYFERS